MAEWHSSSLADTNPKAQTLSQSRSILCKYWSLGNMRGRTFCNFLWQFSEAVHNGDARHGRGAIWVMLKAHYIMEDASWLNKLGRQLELSEVLNTESEAYLTLKYSFCMKGFLCFCHSFTVNQLLSFAASWGSSGAATKESVICRNIIFILDCTYKSMFFSFFCTTASRFFRAEHSLPLWLNAKIEDERKLAHRAKNSGTLDKSLFYVALPSLSSRWEKSQRASSSPVDVLPRR